MKKDIGILGSTGSIGVQALDVIRKNREKYNVKVLSANSNVEKLAGQAREFKPDMVVIGKEELYEKLASEISDLNVVVEKGDSGLETASNKVELDLLLIALVGFSGVKPTVNAVRNNINIALANKEALVAAGNIVKEELEKNENEIIPVDSEHSAIFQAIKGEKEENIKKLILTASGGPFLNKDKEKLENVTPEEALKHPNWDMGNKITVDSATMMNKGLEVIEAYWLFDVFYEKIQVLIHPQSIVHSLVEFLDGSLKAELGTADMKRPIQYAFTCPERVDSGLSELDLINKNLEFFAPDYDKFPCLSIAYDAGKEGGILPCVMNAANEVAVKYFLKKKIKFLDIPDIIKITMEKIQNIKNPSLESIFEADRRGREIAKDLIINKINNK